jgi:hypothetical protein
VYRQWRDWVVDNLGHDSRSVDRAAVAAAEVALAGGSYTDAAAAARAAWGAVALQGRPEAPPQVAEAAWIGRIGLAIPLLMDVAPFALWTRVDNLELEWLLVAAPFAFFFTAGMLRSISHRAGHVEAVQVLARYTRWASGLGFASLLLMCFSVLFVCAGGPASLRT